MAGRGLFTGCSCSVCSVSVSPLKCERFHPEIVLLANLGGNLHVCLCGDLQVTSPQVLDFLDIDQTGTRREAVGLSTRRA